jgi:hypothetical protein
LNGASTLNAGQTGQSQWTIVANSEGFYNLNFGINATLEGLPTGPVNLTGSASGGVLVRNPYFNMTFTVPAVVRSGELFNVYATVTNISQAPANNLTVAIDAASLSGALLTSGPIPPIPTLNGGARSLLRTPLRELPLLTGESTGNFLNLATKVPLDCSYVPISAALVTTEALKLAGNFQGYITELRFPDALSTESQFSVGPEPSCVADLGRITSIG